MLVLLGPMLATVAAMAVFAVLILLGRRLVGGLGLEDEPPPEARFEPPPPPAAAPGDRAAARQRAEQRLRRARACADALAAVQQCHELAALADEALAWKPELLQGSPWGDGAAAAAAITAAADRCRALAADAEEHMHDADPASAEQRCADARRQVEAERADILQALGGAPRPDLRRLLLLLLLLIGSLIWCALLLMDA